VVPFICLMVVALLLVTYFPKLVVLPAAKTPVTSAVAPSSAPAPLPP
jgi:hypothetical protein